jgi:hypothetical protein
MTTLAIRRLHASILLARESAEVLRRPHREGLLDLTLSILSSRDAVSYSALHGVNGHFLPDGEGTCMAGSCIFNCECHNLLPKTVSTSLFMTSMPIRTNGQDVHENEPVTGQQRRTFDAGCQGPAGESWDKWTLAYDY